MIKLIVGSKGSGKTKTLISMCNEAVKNTDGCVVCIEKAMSLQFSIVPQVRLIHADAYNISGYDEFYGFISGVLAGNYDISVVYIDAFLKLVNATEEQLIAFFAKLERLVESANCDIVISYSEDTANVPECIRKYQI